MTIVTSSSTSNSDSGSSTVSTIVREGIAHRAEQLLGKQLLRGRVSVDRVCAVILIAQWFFAAVCAAVVSPRMWNGVESALHPHVWMAICLGGVVTCVPLILVWRLPGAVITRHVIAVAQMLHSSLLIHVMGGRIEAHFHIFGSLALLAFYRDWRVMITATVVVAGDHVLRGWLWPLSIYGTQSVEPWRWLEHAAWVVFEDVILFVGIRRSLQQSRISCLNAVDVELSYERVEALVTQRSAALKSSEAMFRNIVKTAHEGIWLVDSNARTTFINERMADLLGYTVDEIQGTSMYAYMDKESEAVAERNFLNRKNGSGSSQDFCFNHKNGQRLWVLLSTNAVLDDDGSFIGALALATDITSRREDESRIRQAHHESEMLVESITSSLIGLDASGCICKWNDVAMTMFGRQSHEVAGQPLAKLGLGWDMDPVQSAVDQAVMSHQSTTLETMVMHDGVECVYSVMVCPSKSQGGNGSLACLLFVTDVTAQKIDERMRSQGSKLESVGQLAAGVAHEINTPIQFIGDNIRFMQDSYQDITGIMTAYATLKSQAAASFPEATAAVDAAIDSADLDYLNEEIPKALEQGLEGVQRVATIVRALKEFSHPDGAAMQDVDLARSIMSTLTVARNEYKYVADVVTEFGDVLPLVRCIQGEINQVVLNLVVNAAHAISDVVKDTGAKGTITVGLQQDGDDVVIRIADSGSGMPEHIQKKLFTPFFTTKGVGKGTGQGLYIAREIITKKHGGDITLTSEPGVGTTFTIRLPITGTEAAHV